MSLYQSGVGVHDKAVEHQYYRAVRPEMAQFLPPSATRVLDVGCGAGLFLAYLRQDFRLAETWGVEINPQAAAAASQRADRVLVGDIQEFWQDLPERYFDAIYFNDVLEHMVDPYTVLDRIKTYLRPGGRILLSLPNVRHIGTLYQLMVQKDWRYVDAGVLDRTHLRFFTKKSALRMLSEAGYVVERVEGLDPSRKWFVPLLNWLSFRYLDDAIYPQFAFSVQPKD